MSDRWTERLSEYLNGELGVDERSQVETHLATCAECSATLEQLRAVVKRAEGLEDRPPVGELWSGIAERIGASPESEGDLIELDEHRLFRQDRLRQRRLSFSLPQLVAASVALIVLSGGSAWLMVGSASEAESLVATQGLVAERSASSFADAKYGAAIADLERVIEDNRAQLDTATVRIIEENLMIIDRAIAQARRALADDPASSYLNEYLAGTMRQKLEFLRQAASMAGAAS